ncbi:MAG: phytoene desaturase [Planctomycetota bacterium]|jgi:phytoene desaturase
MKRTIVVIGGGLAGLAAATELTTQMRGEAEVVIVEKNLHLGGKMNVLSEKGYHFDMGPTIITMPEVVRGIIRRSGRRVEDYLELVRLDPQWRCFYEDGTVLDLRDDPEAFARDLDRQFPAEKPGRGYLEFLAYARRMYRLSERVFFYKDLGGIGDMIRKPPTDGAILGDVLRMRMHSTVARTAHRSISEPHLAQLTEHFMQYIGSSPFLAPAILSLIASAQGDYGCWYAMGGTRMVARALERVFTEQGGRAELGVGARRILTEGGRVRGVELEDGRTIACDTVVSNCDVQRTYTELLGTPEAHAEQRAIAAKYGPACSGVVLYLGLDRRYEHLRHNCFIFSGNSQQEFDDIYRRGEPARDPTLYLCVPSASDPSQAPEGGESLYILVHTAYRRDHHDWDAPGGMFDSYRRVILDKLKRFGMEDIEDHIVVERRLTPAGIDRMYNATGGAIYGLASHGRLQGGFKPRNTSPVVKGLFLAGGSVNPGPGTPMVMMSGVTAAWSACESLGVEPDRGATDVGLGSTVGGPVFESLLQGELGGNAACRQPAMST